MQCTRDVLDASKYTVLVQNDKAAKTVENQLDTLTNIVSLEVNGTDNGTQDSGCQFDLVLMVNITHQDSDSLLREVKPSLKEGGRICIIEIGEAPLSLGIALAALQPTR